MSKPQIDVEWKALAKELKGLDKKVANKILRQAMRKSMKVVANEVEQLAPEDTGTLKEAIKVKAGKKSRKGFSIQVQIGEGDFKGGTYYGAFQEFGTSMMEGKGFMRQAFDTKGEDAKQIAMYEIAKGIEKQANK